MGGRYAGCPVGHAQNENQAMNVHAQGLDTLPYQSGFGNEFASEALPGALPVGQNSPQKVPYGLYTELLSGTAFTVPRTEARRTWLYRIRPSANHSKYKRLDRQLAHGGLGEVTPNRLRWNPIAQPQIQTDFIDGLECLTATHDAAQTTGVSIYRYAANSSMSRVFFNADGEWLVVPQAGRLRLATELGILQIGPLEIAVIPRGMRFRVELLDGAASGYVCENHGQALRLPDLGPIGSNGLANPRDFMAPVASYEERDEATELVQKYLGELWSTTLDHSPLDVVAWHGNNVPYKYDLRRFNTIGTVSFDHPDPSIFTVLTSPSSTHGMANIDFVIFPPRWMVAENTFRPPWFHRNLMNEFMGLIQGAYDAKAGGFSPGGASLHSCMSAHGPDHVSTTQAINAELKPYKIDNTMAFMFETGPVLRPTRHALETATLQADYDACWSGLGKTFHREDPL
ncbi:homogentisate 1,2-dioxygenase [Pseudomonas lutea]|uniref:Homogentisate 1,2-dioxygenase n=2 Tax=Pseudomonas TaxID=286 RepID=A0A9X8MGG8_9PSED|nr:homogentisate 1,2-dioxygenase [Pseudomonas lutea]